MFVIQGQAAHAVALTISLASRSVARGDGITSITNANRLRRRRRQAWYLYLRVRYVYTRSHDGGRLSNHFLLLLKRAPASPFLSSFALVAWLLQTRE